MFMLTFQTKHPREAPDLGGVRDRAARPLPGGDYGQGQESVQAEVHGQQRRNLHPRAQRCGLTQVQNNPR